MHGVSVPILDKRAGWVVPDLAKTIQRLDSNSAIEIHGLSCSKQVRMSIVYVGGSAENVHLAHFVVDYNNNAFLVDVLNLEFSPASHVARAE